MKKIFIFSLLLVSCITAQVFLPNTGMSAQISFNSTDWSNYSVICSSGTGCVDIIFVIDTSGSMSDKIDEIYTELGEFALNLEGMGYDGAFGLLTFVDGTENFPAGDTFFHNPNRFRDVIGSLNGAEGGTEPIIDACYVAITNHFDLHWDPGCKHVMIAISDEWGDEGEYTLDQFIARAQAESLMFFLVSTSDNIMIPAIGPLPGRWFDIGTYSMNEVLDAVADEIGEFTAITIVLTNNNGVPITNAEVTITPHECIALDPPANATQNTGPLNPGQQAVINWPITEVQNCAGCGDCFVITIATTPAGFEDTLYGCFFVENCGCPGPVAKIIEPVHCGVYTACDRIVIEFEGCFFPVDPNSIQLYVSTIGTISYPNPQMTWDPATQRLTFTPSPPFAEGSTVSFWVSRAWNTVGCQLRIADQCQITIDRTPPVLTGASGWSPACGSTVTSSTVIRFSGYLYDQGAGMGGLYPVYATISSPSVPVPLIGIPGMGLMGVLLTDQIQSVWPPVCRCDADTSPTGSIPGYPFTNFVGYHINCARVDLCPFGDACPNCGPEEVYFNFQATVSEIPWWNLVSQFTVCLHYMDAVDAADCGPNEDSVCCTYYTGTVNPCRPAVVLLGCPHPNCFRYSSCVAPSQGVSFTVYDTTGRTIDPARTWFTSYVFHEAGGSDINRFNGASGYASWSGNTVTIRWTPYSDGDSVVISIDSVYTTDGCLTIPH